MGRYEEACEERQAFIKRHEKADEVRVATAMIRHGGSFVHHLGVALTHADANNTRRIREAFPDYWETYRDMAEVD